MIVAVQSARRRKPELIGPRVGGSHDTGIAFAANWLDPNDRIERRSESIRNGMKPELLAFAAFGISLVATLSGNAPLRGLTVACLGVLMAMIGTDPQVG